MKGEYFTAGLDELYVVMDKPYRREGFTGDPSDFQIELRTFSGKPVLLSEDSLCDSGFYVLLTPALVCRRTPVGRDVVVLRNRMSYRLLVDVGWVPRSMVRELQRIHEVHCYERYRR